MLDWLNSWQADERGNALIEFAFVIPLWLLLTTGMFEVGRAMYQTNALEKSVRAAALFAARHSFPLSAAVLTQTENLVKTGSVTGASEVDVSGWAKASSNLQITTSNFAVDDVLIPVVRISATVPFDPMMKTLPTFFGIKDFTMSAEHEQAYVGD
ncbi:MAG: pilus assembly protein [Rhodospirillales bacterium]|nr:pilus assembly protein [Rhodospirillales bacterium]